jgi:integrase
MLTLITGARIGELLGLRWEDCADGYVTFWQTKNGKMRQVEITPSIARVLDRLPKAGPWVFTNARTPTRYTVNGARHVFDRAVARAGLGPDVTPHTLRHTALSRMTAAGFDDDTVMEISGHSSTRMLARYTHPTAARKQGALETFGNELLEQNLGSPAEPLPEPDQKLGKC